MIILPFHQRMAELWLSLQRRKLSDAEQLELHHCMAANAKLCWEMSYLENISLLASMTNDVDWQHEICREIESLQFGKIKKPGRKGTDKKSDQ